MPAENNAQEWDGGEMPMMQMSASDHQPIPAPPSSGMVSSPIYLPYQPMPPGGVPVMPAGPYGYSGIQPPMHGPLPVGGYMPPVSPMPGYSPALHQVAPPMMPAGYTNAMPPPLGYGYPLPAGVRSRPPPPGGEYYSGIPQFGSEEFRPAQPPPPQVGYQPTSFPIQSQPVSGLGWDETMVGVREAAASTNNAQGQETPKEERSSPRLDPSPDIPQTGFSPEISSNTASSTGNKKPKPDQPSREMNSKACSPPSSRLEGYVPATTAPRGFSDHPPSAKPDLPEHVRSKKTSEISAGGGRAEAYVPSTDVAGGAAVSRWDAIPSARRRSPSRPADSWRRKRGRWDDDKVETGEPSPPETPITAEELEPVEIADETGNNSQVESMEHASSEVDPEALAESHREGDQDVGGDDDMSVDNSREQSPEMGEGEPVSPAAVPALAATEGCPPEVLSGAGVPPPAYHPSSEIAQPISGWGYRHQTGLASQIYQTPPGIGPAQVVAMAPVEGSRVPTENISYSAGSLSQPYLPPFLGEQEVPVTLPIYEPPQPVVDSSEDFSRASQGGDAYLLPSSEQRTYGDSGPVPLNPYAAESSQKVSSGMEEGLLDPYKQGLMDPYRQELRDPYEEERQLLRRGPAGGPDEDSMSDPAGARRHRPMDAGDGTPVNGVRCLETPYDSSRLSGVYREESSGRTSDVSHRPENLTEPPRDLYQLSESSYSPAVAGHIPPSGFNWQRGENLHGPEPSFLPDDGRVLERLARTSPSTEPKNGACTLPEPPALATETREIRTLVQTPRSAKEESFWREVEKAKVRKLCLQCRRYRQVNAKVLVCEKCSRVVPRNECSHCGEEFYMTKPSEMLLRKQGRLMCLECGMKVMRCGDPNFCRLCRQWAAFRGLPHCDLCAGRLLQYGAPVECEECGKRCAFKREPDKQAKIDNKLLCHLCIITFKKRSYAELRRRKKEGAALTAGREGTPIADSPTAGITGSPETPRVCENCSKLQQSLDEGKINTEILRTRFEAEMLALQKELSDLSIVSDRQKLKLDEKEQICQRLEGLIGSQTRKLEEQERLMEAIKAERDAAGQKLRALKRDGQVDARFREYRRVSNRRVRSVGQKMLHKIADLTQQLEEATTRGGRGESLDRRPARTDAGLLPESPIAVDSEEELPVAGENGLWEGGDLPEEDEGNIENVRMSMSQQGVPPASGGESPASDLESAANEPESQGIDREPRRKRSVGAAIASGDDESEVHWEDDQPSIIFENREDYLEDVDREEETPLAGDIVHRQSPPNVPSDAMVLCSDSGESAADTGSPCVITIE